MKKLIALFVVMLTIGSLMAAITYDRSLFVGDGGAAPVTMKGTLKVNNWEAFGEDICGLVKGKDKFDVYLAFCQPCIACVPCEENIKLEFATLYIVEKSFVLDPTTNKKKKVIYVTEVDVTGKEAWVGTGKKGMEAKKGDVVLELGAFTQDNYGDICNLAMVGTWNRKAWFTGIDNETGIKYPANMGIIQKLDANLTSSIAEEFWACGTLSLRRDDSFTKKQMLRMVVDTKKSKKVNPWDICEDPVVPEFQDCEFVMTNGTITAMEDYIYSKYKGYEKID